MKLQVMNNAQENKQAKSQKFTYKTSILVLTINGRVDEASATETLDLGSILL